MKLWRDSVELEGQSIDLMINQTASTFLFSFKNLIESKAFLFINSIKIKFNVVVYKF